MNFVAKTSVFHAWPFEVTDAESFVRTFRMMDGPIPITLDIFRDKKGFYLIIADKEGKEVRVDNGDYVGMNFDGSTLGRVSAQDMKDKFMEVEILVAVKAK